MRIRSASDTHRLVYIRTSGQRVSDAAAETGRRTAERFDFRRMVMRFILKEKEPVFFSIDSVNRHFDCTRIDFFGRVQIFQAAFFAKRLHGHRRHIHECHRTVGLFPVHAKTGICVLIPCLFDRFGENAVFNSYFGKFRGKRGMTAVIGPVSVKYTDLSDCRIALFFRPEIFTNHSQIIMAHGKSHVFNQSVDPVIIQFTDTLYNRYRLRLFNRQIQGFRFFQRCFS